MKHPHYNVMMEWAADTSKVVQYRRHPSNDWEDERGAPDFNGFGEYRIKPEKKQDVVQHWWITPDRVKVVFNDCSHAMNLRLTFSGKDGTLIKAEVL